MAEIAAIRPFPPQDGAAPASAPRPATARSGTLVTLQGLRFFAALLVLLSHVREEWLEMAARRGEHPAFPLIDGSFGVEIFFIISGFIMVHVAGQRFGTPGAPLRFMKDRLARIVPLYWTLTAAQCLYVIGTARHDAAEHGIFGVGPLLRSLFFIPYMNTQGHPRPILAQGWTLDFEIGFYLIFALCLVLPRAAGLVTAMLALALLAFSPDLGLDSSPLVLLGDPIVLYFACGIALATLRRWMLERGTLPRIPFPLLGCAVLVLMFVLLDNLAPSPVWHWVFAIGVVSLAVLSADMERAGSVGATAVLLGNVSYSLYLSHGFVLELARIVWRRAFDWGQPMLYLAIVPVLAVAAAYLCYRWIEKPLDARFRKHRLIRQKAAQTAS